MSLISGLEIGRRSLNAYKSAITITGHNVSNVGNPNYTRQKPDLEPAMPQSGIPSGVDLETVSRQRDRFADLKYREQAASLGRWDVQTGYLEQVEGIVGGDGEGSLIDLMNRFWNGWHDLANSPESEASRISLIQSALALTDKLNEISSSLNSVRSALNDMIEDKVSRVNDLLEEVADLNVKIASLIRSGGNPSDLQDRRDAVLDELSRLASIGYSDGGDGSVSVRIGGVTLVEGAESSQINLQRSSDGDLIPVHDEIRLRVNAGEIGGLIELGDKLDKIIGRMDEMAGSLIERINELHSSGYGLDGSSGVPFFSGENASDIAVNPDLIDAPEKVAASGRPDAPGDNSVALAIAQLRSQFDEHHASTVALIGSQTAQAEREAENGEILLRQIGAYRQGEFGVSLDEELTNLIRFQRAYQAAAKFVSSIDELLQTVINMM
ncbi:TPA: flagellar hook-associated protein FlgK [Candidatus Poribacteria bacterium]|nr:flagellar hook-associated protein FlgK [Candidatus Poribacteria bacterium]